MEITFAIFIFAFSTTVTPGPNNIMIMSSGMNYGIKRSIPHFIGICIGFPLMVICIGLGFGTVFAKFPIIHDVIKILGICYLLYLAYQIAITKPTEINGNQKTAPLTLSQAALFQWVNPKAWIMAMGAVATYTSTSLGIYFQVTIISLAFLIAAFPCVGVWLFLGARIKKILKKSSHQRVFNISMGALLVISILPIIAEYI